MRAITSMIASFDGSMFSRKLCERGEFLAQLNDEN